MEERSTRERHAGSVWINEAHIVFRALDVSGADPIDYRRAGGEFPRWAGRGVTGPFPTPMAEDNPCRN